ncbi:MAG: elongation factor G [Candidatus Latescibacteria bacterium]|nr:elongation factor G [Candidatus Latescibacterota bacterium]
MKEYEPSQIRNIALIGHGDSGKTTLTEALLLSAGETTRMGSVEDGSTHSDYSPDEIERGISLAASMLHCTWRGHKLNIIDTPGYTDFTGETKGAMRAVDNAVVVLRSIEGVEVGTEQVWKYAADYELPRLLFVNKLRKEHANFHRVYEMIVQRFGQEAIPFQIPVDAGEQFESVIDLVRMKKLVYEVSGKGKPVREEEIPAELSEQAEAGREKLIEAAAESDDALLEKYLEEGELSDEELIAGLRAGVLAKSIFPVFCGDSLTNVGVDRLMDAMCSYLATPSDIPTVAGKQPDTGETVQIETIPAAPLSALVFKTVSEPHVGELSFFRVYSGTLRSGADVLNTTKAKREHIGQIYFLNGKERHEIGTVPAGDMGALVKLKDTHTGDTLCDRAKPIRLPGIDFPKPVIRVAVEPKAKGDEEKISAGLAHIHEEDPTFVFNVDGELKQTIISGQGELHLEVVVGKLKNKFGVDVELIKPKIPYRETILGTSETRHKYKKQSGGRGQYGEVYLRLEPLPRGSGFEFVDAITGGAIPGKFIPAVEKGLAERIAAGVLAHCPVVDVKVTLYDGSFHTVDSSEMAFKLAASMAFKTGFLEAKPVLLEPIYHVEVTVPEEYMGDVMGDLSSRRGKIQGMEPSGHFQIVRAQVPLSELYRYSTTLRSLTQGRGIHSREFSHYEQVPHEVAEKVIEAANSEKE